MTGGYRGPGLRRWYYYYYFLKSSVHMIPRGFKKLLENAKIGTKNQSVQS